MARLGGRQRDKYLATISLHRDQMKRVCKSIKLHKQWCNQQIWVMEVVFFDYLDLSLFSPYFIESQECNKCLKTFSPEMDLSKHVCREPNINDFVEATGFSQRERHNCRDVIASLRKGERHNCVVTSTDWFYP